MITTLTGENSFGWQAAANEMVQTYLAENDVLGLERIDGQEVEIAKLVEAVQALPFLVARKLVILRQPSSLKEFLSDAEHILANVPDSTDVIIVEPKLDKRLSYYKFLKKSTDFKAFPELDDVSMSQWLVDYVTKAEGNISREDARFLVNRVGTNQRLLASEIDKLLLNNEHITKETILELTDQSPQSTIFQLIEAAFAGNDALSLKLYSEQRALKVEPQQIIALLGWQLHALLIVKTAGDRSVDSIAKDAKLNPFVIRKNLSLARSISLSELKQHVHDLVQIDRDSKRTNINIDEALQHYLLSLNS